MKQLIQRLKDHELRIEEVPAASVRPAGVLVRNRFSLISAGTERMVVDLGQKSILGKARARPDLTKQVMQQVKRDGFVSTFLKVMERMDSPVPLGYSSSGVVEAVGEGTDGYRASFISGRS